jgi:hypothetical protein
MVTHLQNEVELSIDPDAPVGALAPATSRYVADTRERPMTQHDTSTTPDRSLPPDPARGWPPRRLVLVTLAVVSAALLVAGLVLFQPWRLVTRSTVDEALPVVATTSAERVPTGAASADPGDVTPSVAATSAATAPAGLRVLSEGRFVDAEHPTSGTARIVQLADGSRYLRLEGFSTSDGPDVDVWLTDQPAGGDWHRYDDGVHVALGDLKGTDGNQNYAIPADVDLSRLTSVAIWCDRFDVAFGTAPIRIA